MLPPVLENVDEAVPHFAGRAERPGMVAVGPELAPAPENAVRGPCEPDRKPLEAARESELILCLHQEVHVVGLDRELEEPEAPPGGSGQRSAERREDATVAERRQRPSGTKGDVHRMAGLVPRPGPVRYAHRASGWLSAGADALAAPGAGPEFELVGVGGILIEAIIAEW
jgi:hypothetical protein